MNLSQLPQHIFGMHDAGAERIFGDAGRRAWVVLSKVAGDAPEDFSALSNAGHGVIVRLNNGYGSAGTIPFSSQYDALASACARYVAGSQGAHIWIIGNETNLKSERPGSGSPEEEVITPEKYAQCFAKCRAAIKDVSGHGDDWVIPAPPGPWNVETSYPANPLGDWVNYFRDLLSECVKQGAPPDALALHTYTLRNYDAGFVTSEAKFDNPAYASRHFHFRAYQDFLSVVPPSLRALPVFITEAQANPWENRDVGWIQAAYAEIHAWNANTANQPIQALCLFRWQSSENENERGWGISDKPRVIQDLRAALQNEYGVRWLAAAPVPTKPAKPAPGVLPLAKARWFVEEAIRKLEAQDGGAAREILVQTVIPWFYATSSKHSTSLPNAQAHTAARWHCEEATRQIEAGALNDAANRLQQQVLPWLYSPGPGALGILSVEYKAKPKAKSKSKPKTAPRKKRAAKPRSLLLSADAPALTKKHADS